MKDILYEKIRKFFNKYRGCRESQIDYKKARAILKNDKTARLIDVRSPQEYKEGHLEKSINIPLYDIETKIEDIIKDKETLLIIYCQSGNRSRKAIEILSKKGYENLYNIEGGLDSIEY